MKLTAKIIIPMIAVNNNGCCLINSEYFYVNSLDSFTKDSISLRYEIVTSFTLSGSNKVES